MITKITTKNFPGIRDGSYEFGRLTKISGPNGSGKTAFARAILWAICGNFPEIRAEVSLETETRDLLSRIRKASKNEIRINDKPTTQDEISSFLGCSTAAFSFMFFPSSIFYSDPQDLRSAFTSILPPIDAQALVNKYYPGVKIEADIERQRKNANSERIVKQKRLSQVLAEISALGATEEIQTYDEDALVAEREEKQALLKSLGEEEARLDKLLDAWEYKYANDLKEYQQKIAENDARTKHNAWVKEQKTKIRSLEPWEKQLDDLEEKKEALQDDLTESKARGLSLAKEIEEYKRDAEKCASCGRAWENPDEVLQKIKEVENTISFERRKYESLRQELAETEKSLNSLYGECRAVAVENAKIEALAERALHDLVEPVPPTEPCPSKGQIAEVREKWSLLAKEISALSVKILQAQESRIIATKRAANLANLETEKEKLEKQISELEFICAALHEKTGIPAMAAKMQLENLALPGFRFEFTETLKNGNERDCFKIVRSDGVSYQWLSSGEQVKLGLQIAELIAELSNCRIKSVFLSTADLADSLRKSPLQMIVERVEKGEKTIEIKG